MQTSKEILIIMLTCLMTLSFPFTDVLAADYYVAPPGTSGASDSWTLSQNDATHPWATLQHAFYTVPSGTGSARNNLYLLAGEYNAEIGLYINGGLHDVNILKASGTVTIKPTATVAGSGNHIIMMTNTYNIAIDGIDIDGINVPFSCTNGGIGIKITTGSSTTDPVYGITIQDLEVKNCPQHGLQVTGTAGTYFHHMILISEI